MNAASQMSRDTRGFTGAVRCLVFRRWLEDRRVRVALLYETEGFERFGLHLSLREPVRRRTARRRPGWLISLADRPRLIHEAQFPFHSIVFQIGRIL